MELIPFRKSGKWGFVNKDKVLQIECIYDAVNFFKYDYDEEIFNLYLEREEVAEVIFQGAKKIINKQGKVLFDNIYDGYRIFLKQNIAEVKLSNKKWIIELHTQRKISKSSYDKINFTGIIFITQNNNKYGALDYYGNEILECEYINNYAIYSDEPSSDNMFFVFVNTQNEEVVIDKNFKCIFRKKEDGFKQHYEYSIISIEEKHTFTFFHPVLKKEISYSFNYKYGLSSKVNGEIIPCSHSFIGSIENTELYYLWNNCICKIINIDGKILFEEKSYNFPNLDHYSFKEKEEFQHKINIFYLANGNFSLNTIKGWFLFNEVVKS